MKFITKLVVYAVASIITAYILPGVVIASPLDAFIVAAVLVLLQSIVKPILIVLTLPITILTLGLFIFVVNAIIVLLADAIVPGFYVVGFWWALLFSLIVSLIVSVFESMDK